MKPSLHQQESRRLRIAWAETNSPVGIFEHLLRMGEKKVEKRQPQIGAGISGMSARQRSAAAMPSDAVLTSSTVAFAQ